MATVLNEVRLSSYVKEEVCEKVQKTNRHHNASEEIAVLRWLHSNKYIDATLCMITDTENLSISYDSGLNPTSRIMGIIEAYQ